MNLLDAMQELLSCKADDGRTHAHAILEESDPSSKLRKVTLSNLKPGMLVLHIDNGRKVFAGQSGKKKLATVCMSPLFSMISGKDHNCSCDAVLIRIPDENDPACEIFYIELKSDRPYGYSGQFRSAKCFFRYMQIVLKEFWGIDMRIAKERYIVLHTDTENARTSLGKQRPQFSSQSANRPEKPEMHIVKDGMTVRCTELF